MNRYGRMRQAIVDGLFEGFRQRMRSLHGHVPIYLDMELDESKMTRLPSAKIMIAADSSFLLFNESPDPDLLVFGQGCIQEVSS